MDAQGFALTYNLVRQWGRDRKILPNGTVEGQARKTLEEAGELRDAARDLAYAQAKGESIAEPISLLRDGVGDTLVTLVMVCELAGIEMSECFALAYNVIKDRRGEMGEDGVFYRSGQKLPDGRVVE